MSSLPSGRPVAGHIFGDYLDCIYWGGKTGEGKEMEVGGRLRVKAQKEGNGKTREHRPLPLAAEGESELGPGPAFHTRDRCL